MKNLGERIESFRESKIKSAEEAAAQKKAEEKRQKVLITNANSCFEQLYKRLSDVKEILDNKKVTCELVVDKIIHPKFEVKFIKTITLFVEPFEAKFAQTVSTVNYPYIEFSPSRCLEKVKIEYNTTHSQEPPKKGEHTANIVLNKKYDEITTYFFNTLFPV